MNFLTALVLIQNFSKVRVRCPYSCYAGIHSYRFSSPSKLNTRLPYCMPACPLITGYCSLSREIPRPRACSRNWTTTRKGRELLVRGCTILNTQKIVIIQKDRPIATYEASLRARLPLERQQTLHTYFPILLSIIRRHRPTIMTEKSRNANLLRKLGIDCTLLPQNLTLSKIEDYDIDTMYATGMYAGYRKYFRTQKQQSRIIAIDFTLQCFDLPCIASRNFARLSLRISESLRGLRQVTTSFVIVFSVIRSSQTDCTTCLVLQTEISLDFSESLRKPEAILYQTSRSIFISIGLLGSNFQNLLSTAVNLKLSK